MHQDIAFRVACVVTLNAPDAEEVAILACRFLAGLSEEETAAVLSLRRGTVKSRPARALERLRSVVGEEVGA